MEYLLLIAGFVFLVKGADFFVDGAASIAYKFHIPVLIVGLTIVALGTSLPEFSVSLQANLAGSNELALSNVTGSNIFNTLVVVGTSCLIAPFLIDKKAVSRDLVINIGVTLLLALFAFTGRLGRMAGVIMLLVLFLYILFLILDVIRSRKEGHPEEDEDEKKILSNGRCLIYIVLGAFLIFLGGELTVDNARIIAANLGMSQTLIGLTIVALGTSLPELVTSVVAAGKGESGLSLGNAIGSNILNILFILGFSATVHPLPVLFINQIDIWILVAVSLLMYGLSRVSDRFGRGKGILMLACYALYLAYILMR